MFGKKRKIILAIAIVVILLSIYLSYVNLEKIFPPEKPNHYCKFTVDAGPDIEVSTNESFPFYGRIHFPCDYKGGIGSTEWDFDGDGIVDWSNSGITDNKNMQYWGSGLRFYYQYIFKYKEPGIYNATFRAKNTAQTYKAEDVKTVYVYETKLNLTIKAKNNPIPVNDTLKLDFTLENQGCRGFNLSKATEANETVRLYLIREDGIIFKKTIQKYPTYSPPGPLWMKPGDIFIDEIVFDLSKEYENETINIYGYKPSEHPGKYPIYVQYVTLGRPQSWISNMYSNSIEIMID